MQLTFVLKKVVSLLLFFVALSPVLAYAGGIVLGATRIIYPVGQKEVSITVRNTSDSSRFMVQTWIENQHDDKTNDFIVTPPLYVSNPGNENNLRIMYAGPELPTDRESLFYLTAKAIPAIDKSETEGKNVLMLSAATRIKIFVRPVGLKLSPADAISKLTFSRSDKKVTVQNPTPYYITLTGLKADTQAINESVMVPPQGLQMFSLPSSQIKKLTYQSINDYGGLSNEQIWNF